MMEIKKEKSIHIPRGNKQKSYNEITKYLDAHWSIKKDPSLKRVKKLNSSFDYLTKKVNTLLVAGTNGKSTTIHFACKLLKEEGLKVGAYYSPHILAYNERFNIGQESILNKEFVEIANEVISTAERLKIEAHTSELLTIIGLKYFVKQEVDVAIFEVNDSLYDPVSICNSKITSITRVTNSNVNSNPDDLLNIIKNLITSTVHTDTHVISADQNKSHLQYIQELTQTQKGRWAMPIRKLAPLSYPFEQLHGRCAALAERIAQIYIESFVVPHTTIVNDSLLTKSKGQRGRPTLEAKKQSELNPRKTLEQFWKETLNELPSRFHMLSKEKPSILLDTADNIDALNNLLLGIRLLHYQKPLKGLTIIIGAQENALYNEEFLKLMRYFFKKTSGQLIVCPIDHALPGTQEKESWNAEKVANDIKAMKVKARACKSFNEAFNIAKETVDQRDGLVVITGSKSIINNYWRLKDIKKF